MASEFEHSVLGEALSRGFVIVLAFVLAAGIAVDGYALRQRRRTESGFQEQVAEARAEAARIQAQLVLPTTAKLPSGENFASALQRFGLNSQQADEATAAAQNAFNLRQLRAGNNLTIGRSVAGELREIDYKIDANRMLHIVPATGGFSAEVREIPSRVEVSTVNGELRDSLFNAVEQAGESAEVAMRMVQIFGYDLDFYTDPRKGDTFCVIIEKKSMRTGKPLVMARSLRPSMTTAQRNIRRCCSTMTWEIRHITRPTVNRCRRPSFAPR